MPSGEFTDIALMVGRIGDGHPRSTPNGRHFDEPVEVGPDLYIGPPGEIAEAVMDACTPRGENTLLPERQFGSRYAFFRRNAPAKPRFEWDSDRKLSILMMLSRLIRPTSISMQYAARVFTPSTGKREIVPAWSRLGARCHVTSEADNWLRDHDVDRLRDLWDAFARVRDALPNRIRRAMWYHEHAAFEYYAEVRGLLYAAALESLVHTDDRTLPKGERFGSTRQFVGRMVTLQGRIPELALCRDELSEIYEFRSNLAHGGDLPGGITDKVHKIYLQIEAALREVIVRAIYDPSIAAIFEAEQSVRTKLPPADTRV